MMAKTGEKSKFILKAQELRIPTSSGIAFMVDSLEGPFSPDPE